MRPPRLPTITALLAAYASSTCSRCADTPAEITRMRARLDREHALLLLAEDRERRQRDEIGDLQRKLDALLAVEHRHVWVEHRTLSGVQWRCQTCGVVTKQRPAVAA